MENKKQFQDFQRCKESKGILQQLDTAQGEEVVFSCLVIKINRFGMRQDRTLLLTNKFLYNIKKEDIKRKINVSKIKSVTKSTKDGNREFVIHVKSEYDYRFESDYRKDIFEAIKYVYWRANKTNLPVFGVPDRLKDYHTSKRDIEHGTEVEPDPKYRRRSEDRYSENADEQ